MRTRIKYLLVGFTSLCLVASLAQAVTYSKRNYLKRQALKDFIDNMVRKHDFSSVDLVHLFSQVKPQPEIIRAITSPAEAKPWYQYRKIFLKEKRIAGGVRFWNKHEAILNRAEKVYGVPPQIIVAILGVETRYVTYTGKHRVMDALSTLAFDYPKRSKFFLSELEHFLLLTREEKINPMSIKGSYAGAMGGPQFISSSYRHYAVDFDNDGKRDLWNNRADMIGSVANYFSRHGWKRGEPVTVRANVSGELYKSILGLGIKPQTSLLRLKKYSITPVTPLPDYMIAAIIRLDNEKDAEYWLGLNNFYVITRYNHSPLYAMAVYQLSEEIAKRRKQQMQEKAKPQKKGKAEKSS